MKSLVKGTLFAATAAFVFSACNKDQSCINKLDGQWTAGAGKFYINGVEQQPATPDPNDPVAVTTYSFTKFKTKDISEGIVTIKTVVGSNTTTTPATYKVMDDCKKFWWSTDATTTADDMTADITTLSGSKFEFTFSMQVPNATGGNDTWKYDVMLSK